MKARCTTCGLIIDVPCPLCALVDKLMVQANADMLLPDYMLEGTRLWLARGIIGPGSFLEFVFKNDLVHACGQADENNRARIFNWASVLYNLPAACWGHEEFKSWQEMGGLASQFKDAIDPNKESDGKEETQ